MRTSLTARALTGTMILGVLATLGAPSAQATTSAACTVQLTPAIDIHKEIRSSVPAATFCFATGTYELASPISPKAGQTFVAAPGTVLSGSKLIRSFEREGNLWVADGQTQVGTSIENSDGYHICAAKNYEGCRFSEAVFQDGKPLRQVTELALLTPGSFFFDQGADRIYLASDPSGRQVEVAVAQRAFAASASNVTVEGFIIEKFANGVHTGGALQAGEGWTVRNNEIRLNDTLGLSAGSGTTVIDNNIHHNGQMGVSGQGAGLVFEGNEIAYNNTAGFSSLWEAGGSKWVNTDGLIVRNNFSHHNGGPGLWTDIDNINTTYEGNVVEDNIGPGIMHEISYDAVIRDNRISRNGKGYRYWAPAGILVIDSPNVEVSGNTLIDNKGGIAVIQDERVAGRHGSLVVDNVSIHDNQVRGKGGWSGFQVWGGSDSLFTADRVNFQDNTYGIAKTERHFSWKNQKLTLKEWKSLGQI